MEIALVLLDFGLIGIDRAAIGLVVDTVAILLLNLRQINLQHLCGIGHAIFTLKSRFAPA